MNFFNVKKNINILMLLISISTWSNYNLAKEKKEEQDLFEVDILLDQKIPMRDGIKLSANIYKPKVDAKNKRKKTPVIVYMTPYINEHIDKRAWYLSQRGFTFVAVDVRGRGNSEGEFRPLIQEAKDGHDIVEWAGVQSWSSGRVGMLGGSYNGYSQWATIKEFPKYLETILPIASVGPGIDYPMQNNISYPYMLQWLTYTGGKTGMTEIFRNSDYWDQINGKYYKEHLAFKSLPEIAKSNDSAFYEWQAHPNYDDYWKSHHPTKDDYKKIDIPILSISGFYDADYLGAMNFYKQHMKYGNRSAKKNHFLIMGPWTHGGTRRPKEEIAGFNVGKESVIDMLKLYHDWFSWTLKGKDKPEFLKDRVVYYTIGTNEWLSAKKYEAVPNIRQKLYLSSNNGKADQLFAAGMLSTKKASGKSTADTYINDPLKTYESNEIGEHANSFIKDQSLAMRIDGDGLIYHSKPFEKDIVIAGEIKASLWISMDVPDTDLQINVYEILPDGSSIYLSNSMLRARYRKGLDKEQLIEPGRITKYDFESFYFYAKTLHQGSRIRLVVNSPNTPRWQKNYNSGGVVAEETGKDARKATIKLHHTPEYPSYLELPLKGE